MDAVARLPDLEIASLARGIVATAFAGDRIASAVARSQVDFAGDPVVVVTVRYVDGAPEPPTRAAMDAAVALQRAVAHQGDDRTVHLYHELATDMATDR